MLPGYSWYRDSAHHAFPLILHQSSATKDTHTTTMHREELTGHSLQSPVNYMADIEDEPLFALQAFDQRMADLIEFASTVYVSSEVRDECVRELEEAKKNGYRKV